MRQWGLAVLANRRREPRQILSARYAVLLANRHWGGVGQSQITGLHRSLWHMSLETRSRRERSKGHDIRRNGRMQ